jgi:transposase
MNKTPRILRIEQKFGMDLEKLLRQKYEIERKTTVELGELFGFGDSTVGRWLREYKIHVRSNSEALLKGKIKPDEGQLRQWYEVEKKTTYNIAELVGVSNNTVGCWLREYKIPIKSISEAMLKGKKKSSEKQLKQLYEVEKKSTVEIAELIGVSNSTVGCWLHDYGIPLRDASESRWGVTKNPGEKQLRHWYEAENKSSGEIAELICVTGASVLGWLHKYKIPVKSNSEAHLNGRKKPSEEQLRQWYEVEKKTTVQIAGLIGVSINTVTCCLHDFGIRVRSLAEYKLEGKRKPSKEQLRKWYLAEKKSTREISESLGVSRSYTLNLLRDYEIPVRSISESMLKGNQKPDKKMLRQLYEVERKSTLEIADLFSISNVTVGNLLRDYGIPVRSASEARLNGKKKPGKEQLIQLYETEKRTTYEIAKQVGVTDKTVGRWLHDYQITVRNKDTNRYLKAKALEEVVRRIVE